MTSKKMEVRLDTTNTRNMPADVGRSASFEKTVNSGASSLQDASLLRRTFMFGAIGLILSPFQKPAHGLVWLLRAAGVGIRLFRGVRAASRVSRAFRTGISTTARRSYATGRIYRPRSTPSRAPRSRRDPRTSTRTLSRSEREQVDRSIRRDVDSLRDDVRPSDKEQLARNIWKLTQRISDVMDLRDAMHLVDQWASDYGWDVVEARVHVADCATCNHAFMTLQQGTDIEMIPITNKLDSYRSRQDSSRTSFSGEVTVRPESGRIRPRKELSLPRLPTSMKTVVSGKQLTVRARVRRNGRATIVNVDGYGFSEFIIRRAEEMVESSTWEPARDYAGQPIDGYVRVIFRWP